MDTLLVIAASLALSYTVLLAALWVTRPGGDVLRQSLRLLPDVVRLAQRLARDPAVPRRARAGLWLLLGYLLLPFDLVPDFVPVLGVADDVLLASLVLRRVLRSVPPSTVRGHWPGTEDGLAALGTLLRVPGLRPSPPARAT